MAASAIPPIWLGLIGTGLAVEKLHRPALRRPADRYVVTAFTDRSAEQGGRLADYSGAGPARAAADRAALLARDVDAVLISVPIPQLYEVGARRAHGWQGRALPEADRRRAAVLALDPVPGAGPVPLWRPRGSTGLCDGLPGQRISSSAFFAA